MTRAYQWTIKGRKRRKVAARETAIQYRPWQFSTGPRTTEGKARSRANAINGGFRVEQLEIVTDPDIAEAQIVWAVLRWEDLPTERRAFAIYAWCIKLVELGEGDRLCGLPNKLVVSMELNSPFARDAGFVGEMC